MIEFSEVLQRDPLEGGKARVVRYRRETPMDTWLNTSTGRTFQTPSCTQPECNVRVSSVDPSDADLSILSADQRKLAREGWSPPEPILLRFWAEKEPLVLPDASLVQCPACGGDVEQPDLPDYVCVCNNCGWDGSPQDVAPRTLRVGGGQP